MAPIPDDQEQFEDITATLSNESDKSNSNTSPREQYDLTHMDSASEYSIGSSQASMQMAQYLDDVESGGQNDICSFTDVNLNENSNAVFNDDVEVRRARKRYYLLPMLIRYSLPIGGCLLGFVVLLVTIGVTASVVRSQDEKRMMAMPEVKGDEGFESVGGWDDMFGKEEGVEEVGDFGADLYDDAPIYDDAPVLDDFAALDDFGVQTALDGYVGEQSFDDATALDDYINVDPDGNGDEEVGTPIEFTSGNDDLDGADRTDVNLENTTDDGDEEVGTPIEFTSSTDDMEGVDRTEVTLDDAVDGSNTAANSGSNSGSSNISSSGSTHPKWYTTSHPNYISLLEFHSSTSSNVSPHHTAALFCNNLDQQLCPYSTYCPSGKFADPYNDGPDDLFSMAKEEWEQWAPVNTHGQGTEWVQVGKIIDADGEYGGRCRTYDEWSGGEGVEATVAPEHRRYILCCNSSDI